MSLVVLSVYTMILVGKWDMVNRKMTKGSRRSIGSGCFACMLVKGALSSVAAAGHT